MSILYTLSVDQLIRSLVRQYQECGLLHFDKPNIGALFSVYMQVKPQYFFHNFKGHHEVCERAAFQFIVTGRHRVYVGNLPDRSSGFDVLPPEAFVNTNNHDSCWPEGITSPLDEAYFRLCRTVAGKIPRHAWRNDRQPAPIELEAQTQLGDFWGANPLQFVRITRGAKREDNEYFDTLSQVELLKAALTLG